jgi:hypothetical protein
MRRRIINLTYNRSVKEIRKDLNATDLYACTATWYERLAWWTVKKLGIRFRFTDIKDCFQSIPIDEQRIIDAVDLSAHEIELIHHKEIKYLLIGNKEAHEIFMEMQDMSYFSFPLDFQYCYGKVHQVRGLTVVVVPWMDGFCLVPELK